jgi:single-strand DNA-binding protein
MDPELRHTQSGVPVTNLSMATTRKFKNAQGELKSETTWHRVTVFGKQAANCCEYLSKGDSVMVEGRLSNREWVDREGVKRYTTEVIASRVDFGPKRSTAPAQPESDAPAEAEGECNDPQYSDES